MLDLHKALEVLQPRDFSEVPVSDLQAFISEVFSKAELIANSVPPPPNGTPYESARHSRTKPTGAISLEDLTVSEVRRPPVPADHEELRQAWGNPVKLSTKEAALQGISVYKMAGHDRHGAWFARTSVHEGLGFEKWKRAMQREFPESLEVQGGAGVGSVRGIGGDRRLEEVKVPGLGKMEVYQLSAQFPGPVAPREFITLLLTSENALSDASKVGNTVPRHYIVVSIPVEHDDAPARDGMVRGKYESVEMIREIPLLPVKSGSKPDNKSEDTDASEPVVDDPETNPVEWIMITRSDPGGGIPRFMVERNTPSSIVADAGKFLRWAVKQDNISPEGAKEIVAENRRESFDPERAFSMPDANGILAGVGTSFADKPTSFRRQSHLVDAKDGTGVMQSLADAVGAYIPDALNPLHRTNSQSSSATTISSDDSFASAEEFDPSPEDLNTDDVEPTPSTLSIASGQLSPRNNHVSRQLEKIEQKRKQAADKLQQAQAKLGKDTEEVSLKTAKELEKAAEKHQRERKKQEEKYAKEVQKLEARRERDTKKVLEKQQKEADKNVLLKTQRERDEWKSKAELAEQENKLLKEQILEMQRENTAIVARLGKTEWGLDALKKVKEDLDGKGKGRNRASSKASSSSKASRSSVGNRSSVDHTNHLAPATE